jgi:homocysteine S-methyltransferase
VLATSGADLLACETIPALDEARALVALLAQHSATRAWMSFTSPDGIHTSHGELLTDCAGFLDEIPGVTAIGVNCVRPEVVDSSIRMLRAGSGKPIVVYPNSGERWDANTENWSGIRDHGDFATLATRWIDAGARLVGGCCRIGPRDIASLAAGFR